MSILVPPLHQNTTLIIVSARPLVSKIGMLFTGVSIINSPFCVTISQGSFGHYATS